MSVLVEFSMFPIDGESSKSKYVGRVLDLIDKSGLSYKLTPMSTIIECENITEALGVVEKSYKVLEKDCERVYSVIKLDIRKGKINALQGKIESVKKAIGREIET